MTAKGETSVLVGSYGSTSENTYLYGLEMKFCDILIHSVFEYTLLKITTVSFASLDGFFKSLPNSKLT